MSYIYLSLAYRNMHFKELVGYTKVGEYCHLFSDTAATKCQVKFTHPIPSVPT